MRKLQTKKDILERLNMSGVKANRHQTKRELQKLLNSVEKTKAEKREPAKTEKFAVGRKSEGVKATLYRLFTENPALEISVDDLIAQHLPRRKPSSILTWCGAGGLGSKKYGMVIDGNVQPIMIERDKETDILRRTDLNRAS